MDDYYGMIIELHKDPSVKNVLDVGCNKGSFDYNELPNWQVVCLDYHNTNTVFPKNCVFKKCHFADYDPGKLFDLVICKYTLEHQKNRDAAVLMIQKTVELLRPGGYALFSLPQGNCLSNTIYKALFNIMIHEGIATTRDGGHFTNYSEEELRDDICGAGLNIVSAQIAKSDFAGYPYEYFRGMIKFYEERGYDLVSSDLILFCRKP
jgi:SAM-dependent methyltransferase